MNYLFPHTSTLVHTLDVFSNYVHLPEPFRHSGTCALWRNLHPRHLFILFPHTCTPFSSYSVSFVFSANCRAQKLNPDFPWFGIFFLFSGQFQVGLAIESLTKCLQQPPYVYQRCRIERKMLHVKRSQQPVDRTPTRHITSDLDAKSHTAATRTLPVVELQNTFVNDVNFDLCGNRSPAVAVFHYRLTTYLIHV